VLEIGTTIITEPTGFADAMKDLNNPPSIYLIPIALTLLNKTLILIIDLLRKLMLKLFTLPIF